MNHAHKLTNQLPVPGTIERYNYKLKTFYHSEAIIEPSSLMSEEQLKAFIAIAKEDTNIQEKLKAAKTPDDIISIAKECGHEFTADNLTETLTDEELEGVAGGGLQLLLQDLLLALSYTCVCGGPCLISPRIPGKSLLPL